MAGGSRDLFACEALGEYNINPYLHSRPYLFAAGRFVHKKGFDILIKAYSHFVQKNPKIDLILAGTGEKLEEYKKIAENLGIQWASSQEEAIEDNSGIIYWGRADRREMKSLIAGSAMVVVPSRKEPFGLIAAREYSMLPLLAIVPVVGMLPLLAILSMMAVSFKLVRAFETAIS